MRRPPHGRSAAPRRPAGPGRRQAGFRRDPQAPRGRPRRAPALPPGAARLRRARPVGGRQLVRAGPPDPGDEPGAGDQRHPVRPGGLGARHHPPDRRVRAALAAPARGVGPGGPARPVLRHARGARAPVQPPRGAVHGRAAALLGGGRDLHPRGPRLPAGAAPGGPGLSRPVPSPDILRRPQQTRAAAQAGSEQAADTSRQQTCIGGRNPGAPAPYVRAWTRTEDDRRGWTPP